LLVPPLSLAGQVAREGQVGQREGEFASLLLMAGVPGGPAKRGPEVVGDGVEAGPPAARGL
jgi:hypothetical protein